MKLAVDDELDIYEWVVWGLEVRDPQLLAGGYGTGAHTDPTMNAVCAALGCVFDYCIDDDQCDDIQYYRWLVRVPRAHHTTRTDDGIPQVVQRIQRVLGAVLPIGLTDWTIRPDSGATRINAEGEMFRTEYTDLLDTVEDALLPLRRDGAEHRDPRVRPHYTPLETTTTADFGVWLCADPTYSTPDRFLVLHVGTVTDQAPSDGPPVLVHPRPTKPAPSWSARLTTGHFGTYHHERRLTWPETECAPRPTTGARHEWRAATPQQLVERVTADLCALYPQLLQRP